MYATRGNSLLYARWEFMVCTILSKRMYRNGKPIGRTQILYITTIFILANSHKPLCIVDVSGESFRRIQEFLKRSPCRLNLLDLCNSKQADRHRHETRTSVPHC